MYRLWPNDINSVDNDNCNDERNKKCRVCGDKATGYNFNVISCESCKAFFRYTFSKAMNNLNIMAKCYKFS